MWISIHRLFIILSLLKFTFGAVASCEKPKTISLCNGKGNYNGGWKLNVNYGGYYVECPGKYTLVCKDTQSGNKNAVIYFRKRNGKWNIYKTGISKCNTEKVYINNYNTLKEASIGSYRDAPEKYCCTISKPGESVTLNEFGSCIV